jgi:uncharacterized protein
MGDNPIHEAVKSGRPLREVATVIDAHSHGGPYFNFWAPASDGASMVQQMDRTGVQAMLCAPHIAIGPDPRHGNDLVLEWSRRFPGRILAYAVPYPHEPETAEGELNRAFDAGAVAIKLHPPVHRYSIYDPGYSVAWKVASERHSFILTHTWHGDPYCAPKVFEGMAKAYPDVPIIFGHAGGVPAGFPLAIALAQQYPNIYLDTCGSYIDGKLVTRMVRAVGAERVVFGTDLPFIDSRYCLGKTALADLPIDELRQVMGLNIKRLLARAGVALD